ncbi:MAG: ATP-binding protein [Neisseriaceae bacterium]|nr:ATP-binding protein [Neisseriaceae bacterium]
MQKLIIKNLGPIKNCEMEVRPFTIFIGESGSGKSILLRTISMLKWVYKKMHQNKLFQDMGIKHSNHFDLSKISKESMLDDYIDNNTYIEFLINNKPLIIIANKKLKSEYDNIPISQFLLSKILFLNENRTVIPEVLSSFSGRGVNFSYYTMEIIQEFRKAFDIIGKDFEIESIQDIKLDSKKTRYGYEQIYLNRNSVEIKFENTSSGEKSVSIIELLTYYFAKHYDFIQNIPDAIRMLLDIRFDKKLFSELSTSKNHGQMLLYDDEEYSFKKSLTLLIEEPESNLFPTNQKALTCFLSSLRKKKNNPEIIFSTHSPYILTVVNNLLYADELVNKNSELKEEVNKVIPEKSQLSIDDLSAYVVENGTVESIIDTETNLINGEYIDRVSDKLMSDFDKLYEMKWNK